LKFIKDPVRGNIICSNLEFEIFALPIFNRLHYILQNSMAYFVYPMNRTSRFIHSIGVMDIVTEIFCYALNNSNVASD
jgi:HD superfamily phosphohydrolase